MSCDVVKEFANVYELPSTSAHTESAKTHIAQTKVIATQLPITESEKPYRPDSHTRVENEERPTGNVTCAKVFI